MCCLPSPAGPPHPGRMQPSCWQCPALLPPLCATLRVPLRLPPWPWMLPCSLPKFLCSVCCLPASTSAGCPWPRMEAAPRGCSQSICCCICNIHFPFQECYCNCYKLEGGIHQKLFPHGQVKLLSFCCSSLSIPLKLSPGKDPSMSRGDGRIEQDRSKRVPFPLPLMHTRWDAACHSRALRLPSCTKAPSLCPGRAGTGAAPWWLLLTQESGRTASTLWAQNNQKPVLDAAAVLPPLAPCPSHLVTAHPQEVGGGAAPSRACSWKPYCRREHVFPWGEAVFHEVTQTPASPCLLGLHKAAWHPSPTPHKGTRTECTARDFMGGVVPSW